MRYLIAFTLLLNSLGLTFAQELNCEVKVVSQQIQGSNKSVFTALETSIIEFINNRKWTEDNINNNERIDCSILINITQQNAEDDFNATIQIQSRRPVYGTSYNSTLFNFNDKDFHFKYIINQPLLFVENTYSSNLSSVLAYYVYLILGLDYDSFALKGGDPYLQKALTILNNAQSSGESGWKAFDGSQNRYWIINNILDATFVPLRTAMYNYHRLGMDVMVSDPVKAREEIIKSLEGLMPIHEIKPLSFSIQLFFNAKADEIINIFSEATPEEKTRVLKILNTINPINTNKYEAISK